MAYESSDNVDIVGNFEMHIINYIGCLRTILTCLLDLALIVEIRILTQVYQFTHTRLLNILSISLLASTVLECINFSQCAQKTVPISFWIDGKICPPWFFVFRKIRPSVYPFDHTPHTTRKLFQMYVNIYSVRAFIWDQELFSIPRGS
jgi:hypothetical protein